MKLKHEELIAAVADVAGLAKSEARHAIQALADVVKHRTAAGFEVRIPDLGTFKQVARPELMGRNPQTGEAIAIAASTSLKFTAAKAAKTKE